MSITNPTGKREDSHNVKSVMGRLHQILDHIHKPAKVYPTLAADVNIAGGVGAWGLSAAWVEIVPAAAIADEFDIHWIYASNASAADTYELVLASGGAGSEVEIGRVRFTVPLGAISQASLPIITPINVAGARISAKLASSTGGDDIDMSLGYHTY